MDIRTILGLSGSLLLFLGVFVPIVSLPIIGSVNYFNNGRGDGVIILLLVLISIPLALLKRFHWLWTTGLASMALICYTLITLQSRIAEMTANLHGQLEGNPFRGLAEGFVQGVQMQWGWAILILGSALIIASAALRPRASLRRCPHCAEFIQPDAIVCRYCNRELELLLATPSPAVSRMPRRVAIVTGIMVIGVPLLAWLVGWLPLIISTISEESR
jgi:hypothetical protein